MANILDNAALDQFSKSLADKGQARHITMKSRLNISKITVEGS